MTRKPAVVYSAVYDDEAAALAGLEVLERRYDEEWIGDYDDVAVGEVWLERAFEDAVTGAARSAQREFTTTTERLASDLIEAFKTQAARGGR